MAVVPGFQRRSAAGGWGLPNLELYSWAFSLRALHTWFNEDSRVAWLPIEAAIVRPYRLQDLVFSNTPPNTRLAKFGPIIAHLLSVWCRVESLCNLVSKVHPQFPLFNNHALLSDGQPFVVFHKWKDKGINTLSDLCLDYSLRTFTDLKQSYDLPGNSFFFYLQIRSALTL